MRKKITIILLILTVSIYALNINVQNAVEENDYRPTSLELTPHDPIYITSDSGFEVFPGSGTVENPFIIEGYNITTTSNRGISITDTTKYFVVRDCKIDAEIYGIFINNVTDGTATVINNTCNNNNFEGIWLRYSSSSTITNNICSNNKRYGIMLDNSSSSTVANNTCSNNSNSGIMLDFSRSSTVANNTCSNNYYGIRLHIYGNYTVVNNTCINNNYGISLYLSSSSTVANNTCSNNNYGIYLSHSFSSTVTNNTCSNNNDIGIWLFYSFSSTVTNNTCNNNWEGIRLYYSASCVVTYNLLQENEGYGIYLRFDSDNDLIYYNTFVDNILGGTSQAYDDCTNNTWYDSATQEGNYWSDFSGTGNYSIDGYAGAIDLYPLGPPVITGIIHSPSAPMELDTININATVTSHYGVQSVTLNYRVNSGIWIEVSMTLISGDIYNVAIGSFAANDTIEYYITAVDNSSNHNEATEDNSGLYYSFIIDYTDPAINDVAHSPSTPTELDTVSINAIVTDDSGIYNVTLHYKINIGLWQTISMTLVSGDLYSVTIGSFTVSDIIEYYITALDNSSNHNEAIADNGGLYYVLTVGSSDVIGPSIIDIVHFPSSPTDLDTISINATATDDSGIYNVTLHYRINDGNWTEVSMTLISGDVYSVTIGSFAVSDIIEYYVSAIDNSTYHNEAINDNYGEYYYFTVSEVIHEFQMFSLLLPTITFLSLVFGLIVLQRRKR